jgi:hypothetical protein
VVDASASKVREDVVGIWAHIWFQSGDTSALGVSARDSLASPVEESHVIAYPFAGLMRKDWGVEYGDTSLRLIADGVEEGQELIIPAWKVGRL